MKGYVSFHPIDLSFFDELIAPLVSGRKVNPDDFLRRAVLLRRSGWVARGFAVAVEQFAAAAEPPKADPSAPPWRSFAPNPERFAHRPAPLAQKQALGFVPELHRAGRPFFIAEGSGGRAATAVVAYFAAETRRRPR